MLLFDEQQIAKENWRKYGNPDGRQTMEVSIGLPTFLLDKDNHMGVLTIYLILLVIFVPAGEDICINLVTYIKYAYMHVHR